MQQEEHGLDARAALPAALPCPASLRAGPGWRPTWRHGCVRHAPLTSARLPASVLLAADEAYLRRHQQLEVEERARYEALLGECSRHQGNLGMCGGPGQELAL